MSHLQQSPRATLSAAVRRALTASEQRVAARYATKVGAESLAGDLRRISERVATLVTDGKLPRTTSDSLPVPRWLLDAFRTELIAHLADNAAGRVSGKDLLAVFAALEEIAGRETGPPTSTFSGELAGSQVLQGMREIAHDMRSPLGAILLLVEPIRKGQKGPVTPLQERQLGLIYGAALSLSALASDILDAAREQPLRPVRRPFSISGTIEGACAVVRPIAEEKRLDLRATHPNADGRIGDGAAIQRVLLNLVTNALKYTEQGWVAVGCTELDETRVEFWVEDTGVGLPDHALEVLSHGFHAGPSGFQFSSSGLGLAICRSLLERVGARLDVRTRVGEGTRFSFVLDLPLAPSAAT